MTIEDVAVAQKALIDRMTPNEATVRMRRATVTAVSPLTINLDGVVISGVPFSPRYGPVVGDIVLVLMDGAAPYVLEATNRGGIVYANTYSFLVNTAVTTAHDVSIATPVAPVTGTVEVTTSLWAGFAVGAISGIRAMIYTNSDTGPDGVSAQQTPFGTSVNSGAGAWAPVDNRILLYGCTAGVAMTPVVRFNWITVAAIWVQGIVLVKVSSD